MPSSDDRFYGSGVSYDDMAEAPRRERESNAKNIVVAAGATIGVLFLAAMLFFGSLPALTPEEIVQRADYGGQQPPRHIFNLYSLRQNSERDRALSVTKVDDLSTTTEKNAAFALVEASTATPPGGAGELLDGELIGQPLSNSSVRAKAPEVIRSHRSYEKSELRRHTALPVVSAFVSEDSAVLAGEPDDDSSAVKVLPVHTIKAEQTNLRSQPSPDAPVLRTLSKGQTITVFDKSGPWVQVATNDGVGTTGYVHNSLLEVVEIE